MSKFKAVNNRGKNFTLHRLEQRMRQIDDSIELHLNALDTADQTQPAEADLDVWLAHYNGECTHQGKMCCGRTPLQTLIAGMEAWQEKVKNFN